MYLGEHRSDRNASATKQQQITLALGTQEPSDAPGQASDKSSPPSPTQPSAQQPSLIQIAGQTPGDLGNFTVEAGQLQPDVEDDNEHERCHQR
jgi:hypothetical protein